MLCFWEFIFKSFALSKGRIDKTQVTNKWAKPNKIWIIPSRDWATDNMPSHIKNVFSGFT